MVDPTRIRTERQYMFRHEGSKTARWVQEIVDLRIYSIDNVFPLVDATLMVVPENEEAANPLEEAINSDNRTVINCFIVVISYS